MSNNFKYTTDGKKVVIIGNLNSKEIIVQEIFISDGAEIPSGEQFIVKSLHDAPVESWKDKKLRELEERYKSRKSVIARETGAMEKRYHKSKIELTELIKHSGFCAGYLNDKAVSTFLSFLKGEITHVARFSYWKYEIVSLTDAIVRDDEYGKELKLISLYGRSEGDFEWKINHYSDGSGGSTTIVPCTSFEQATLAIQKKIANQIKARGVTEQMIEAKEKHGLTIPTRVQMRDFYQKGVENKAAQIEKEEVGLNKSRSELAELTDKAKTL